MSYIAADIFSGITISSSINQSAGDDTGINIGVQMRLFRARFLDPVKKYEKEKRKTIILFMQCSFFFFKCPLISSAEETT